MSKKNVLAVSLALALGAFGFGCGKNEAVKLADDMANDICKCKDMKCIEEVNKKFEPKMAKLANAKGSKGDEEAIKKAGEKMAGCMTKMMKIEPEK